MTEKTEKAAQIVKTISQRIEDVEHGIEVIESAQACVQDKVERIATIIPKLKKLWVYLDKDKDGKVSFKEFFNPEVLKLLLVVLGSILVPLLWDVISGILMHWIYNESLPDTGVLGQILNILIGPLIVMFYARYIFAKIMNARDLLLKEKDTIIADQATKIKTLEDNTRMDKQTYQNERYKWDIEKTQMVYAMNIKDQEIKYLEKGLPQEKLQDKLTNK